MARGEMPVMCHEPGGLSRDSRADSPRHSNSYAAGAAINWRSYSC